MISPTPPATPLLVRGIRLVRLVLHLMRGAAITGFVYPFVSRAKQRGLIRQWSRQLLKILCVHPRVHGMRTFPRSTVIVANHVSWLDIWLLHSIHAVCFVAKAEIRNWPLIGWLATRAGTLFIERARRKETSRINRTIQFALELGEVVAIFPESTTSDGTQVRRFHGSLLQPVIDAQTRILAIAIRYPRHDGMVNTDLAYVDGITLWQSLNRILAYRRLEAEVIEAGEINGLGKSRREIALEAEQLIRDALFSGRRRT